jgi:hypothetical protein
MQRAMIAFVVAPLLGSMLFGVAAVVAFPFMLGITGGVAIPLFFLLRKHRRLEWWHALLAGSFCALCFVLVDLIASGRNLDVLVSQNNILFIDLGALVGVVFWWIGIFRNPAFPFVSVNFPWSIFLVVPLAAGGFLAYQALQTTFDQGRVLAIVEEPSNFEHGRVLVRLSSGSTVQADSGITWERSILVGRCFHLIERWSTFRAHRICELMSAFGGGVDDC